MYTNIIAQISSRRFILGSVVFLTLALLVLELRSRSNKATIHQPSPVSINISDKNDEVEDLKKELETIKAENPHLFFNSDGTIDWSKIMDVPKPSRGWELQKHIDVDPFGIVELDDPRTHIVSYADQCCANAKVRLSNSFNISKLDSLTIYAKSDLDPYFIKRNEKILTLRRGAGYWIWKPYVILKKMLDPSVRYGDFVFWIDVAIEFTDDGNIVVQEAIKQKKHMMLFSTVIYWNFNWNKRDAWIYMELDDPKNYETLMMDAAKGLFRKTENSIAFLKEWVFWCQNYSVVTDHENVNPINKTNLGQFVENRHDQTVLSMLQLKHEVEQHRDIAQFYNKGSSQYDAWIKKYGPDQSPWQQIVNHHRDKSK